MRELCQVVDAYSNSPLLSQPQDVLRVRCSDTREPKLKPSIGGVITLFGCSLAVILPDTTTTSRCPFLALGRGRPMHNPTASCT